MGIQVSSLTSLKAVVSISSHDCNFHFGATRSILPERACLLMIKYLGSLVESK
jgi:hypothetical protein